MASTLPTDIPKTKPLDSLLVAILAGAAVLYSALQSQYRTGAFSDDALYVIAAKRLLQKPCFPSLLTLHPVLPLPGLPLLLAPLARFVRPHWTVLEWVSVLATLLSVFLLRDLARRWLDPVEALIVTALFAFNPTVVRFSGVLTPAAYFTMAVLAALLLLVEILERPTSGKAIGLGLVIGWAALLKTDGIVLAVAILGALWWWVPGRRWLPKVLAAAALGVGVAVQWARISHASPAFIGTNLAAFVSFGRRHPLPDALLLVRMLRVYFADGLFGMWSNAMASTIWSTLMLVAVALAVIIVGFVDLWMERVDRRIELATVAGFCGLYFLTCLFWRDAEPRYSMIFLPFSLAFAVRGIRCGLLYVSRPQLWIWVLLVLIGGSYAFLNASALYETAFAPDPLKSPPWESLRWLRENSPADTPVLTDMAPSVELYARRPALSVVPCDGLGMFRYQLALQHLRYIAERDVPALMPGRSEAGEFQSDWKRIRHWMVLYPKWFQPVFQEASEKFSIYRVNEEPGLVEGYEKYLQAARLYESGRYDDAFHGVEEALRIDPQLGAALNLEGAVYLTHNDPVHAEGAFLDALKLLPDSILILMNLATVSHLKGDGALAQQYLDRAWKASCVREEQDQYNQKLQQIYELWSEGHPQAFIRL